MSAPALIVGDYPAKSMTVASGPAGNVLLTSMSRTGSTMVSALLDAHPDIAMCYEVVPLPFAAPLKVAIRDLSKAIGDIGKDALRNVNELPAYEDLSERLSRAGYRDDLVYFLMACRRSQIDAWEVLQILKGISRDDEGDTKALKEIRSAADRLRVARRVLARRLTKARATASDAPPLMAGLKTTVSATHLVHRFPRSRTILLVRDPRDVATSHLRRGWETDAAKVASRWQAVYGRAMDDVAAFPERLFLLRYEDIVIEPQTCLQRICAFLGIRPLPLHEMFHERADVFKVVGAFDPEIHLWWTSGIVADRLQSWRSVLSDGQVSEIEKVCGPEMEFYGYRARLAGE